MGIEAARQVRDQVHEGLAELIRLVNDPATPTADVREVLAGSKAFGAQVLEAERLRRQDLHSAGGEKRSLNQRMADALDTLTSYGSIYANTAGGMSNADSGASERAAGSGSGKCGCGGRPSAGITIVQHLSAAGTEAFAEVGGGGGIPQSVLEEHFCNATIKGVVFSSEGVPLWHGHTKRLATKAQMNALRARYGACGGCDADMWICDGHHIEPVSRGGPTNIDNMMLLCWACHQRVHHHADTFDIDLTAGGRGPSWRPARWGSGLDAGLLFGIWR